MLSMHQTIIYWGKYHWIVSFGGPRKFVYNEVIVHVAHGQSLRPFFQERRSPQEQDRNDEERDHQHIGCNV